MLFDAGIVSRVACGGCEGLYNHVEQVLVSDYGALGRGRWVYGRGCNFRLVLFLGMEYGVWRMVDVFTELSPYFFIVSGLWWGCREHSVGKASERVKV